MTPKRAVVYIPARHQLAFAKLEVLASQRGVKVNQLVGEAIEEYLAAERVCGNCGATTREQMA